MSHPVWTNEHYCGAIPMFFHNSDPRPAREQLDANYQHGGGVRPFIGFVLSQWQTPAGAFLNFPGDPPLPEVGRATLRAFAGPFDPSLPDRVRTVDETLILFAGSWLAIVQPGGEHLICRVD